MGKPPVDVGAVHVRATVVLPAIPTMAVGAPGAVPGVTANDDAE